MAASFIVIHSMENMEKKGGALGAGLLAGAAIGMAAGFFLQSRKGKALTKDAQKKAMLLQKQVAKKLAGLEDLSKDKYAEVVDHVLAYYEKTKEVAKKEMPEVRAYLLKQWKQVEGALKK
jgi:gas vesicle protein